MYDPDTGAATKVASKTSRLIERIRGLLMFIDLPIKKKFLFFAGSILLWFCLMCAISVVSMTAIHYEYYRISENVTPYRQAIESVLVKLQDLDRSLRQIQASRGSADSAGLAYCGKQVEAIRSTLIELRLHQTSTPAGDTIVEQILQDMAKANPEGLQYLREMLTVSDRIDRSLELLQGRRQSQQGPEAADRSQLAAFNAALAPVAEAAAMSTKQLARVSAQYKAINQQLYKNIRESVHTVIGLSIVASLLLVLFTNWIIVAFYRPIKMITKQIDSLSTGDIDLAKKVSITSKDEIGVMSRKFNSLMETVHGMTIYKKVIEEDSSLEDVYRRLG